MPQSIQVVHPPPFDRRILRAEAPGGEPASLGIVVPTITHPGRPFDVRVALADADGYPVERFTGAVELSCEAAVPARVTVTFPEDGPAASSVAGVRLGREGLWRFEGELGGRRWFSNPTSCTKGAAEGIYWGDPHVHTVLSNCHPERCRSLNFCFSAARHFAGLDWVSAADHVSNGRCELARWKEQAAASNAFDDPPSFATLPAYEASLKGGAGGDNNVYMLRWPDLFVDEYDDGDVKTLCRKLAGKLAPGEFFVVPHHTTRTGKHGEIPADIYPGPDLMPVVEIHSKWGTSEYRGNPNPLHEIHPGPAYVTDLLNAGLALGFIGGTDTHSTMPAGFGREHLDRLPGMTAVAAPRLSREGVFHAIRSRRCYATSLERIYLDVTVAGARPGAAVAWPDAGRPREAAVTAAAKSDITAVELVRNGETIGSQAPGGWQGTAGFADSDDLAGLWLDSPHLGRFAYYYVRVTCASGAQAWSSPVWLVAG
jgi:hypothetical protein